MRFESDTSKARLNLKKHGVDFADAATALEDPLAATVEDATSSDEARYVTLGTDALGRLLVVVYTWRLPCASSPPAKRLLERRQYEGG